MSEQAIETSIEDSKPKKAVKTKPTSATDKARAITLAKMAAKQK